MRYLPLLLLLVTLGCPSYHPPGYEDGGLHGMDLRMGTEDCRECHGEDLAGTGTSDVSCDQCHVDGWREDCTYCHGGLDDDSGAPPGDLDGTMIREETSFPPHGIHTFETIKPAYDCVMCHVKPSDVLSPGHAFDATPGRAEVDFTGGIAPYTEWEANGCSNNYCHGDGQREGEIELPSPDLGCDGCHAPPTANGTVAQQLSGKHSRHVVNDVLCADCHPTVNVEGNLVDPTRHVDGQKTIELPSEMEISSEGRCTGTCHNKVHENYRWIN